jgi:hypothetical protein
MKQQVRDGLKTLPYAGTGLRVQSGITEIALRGSGIEKSELLSNQQETPIAIAEGKGGSSETYTQSSSTTAGLGPTLDKPNPAHIVKYDENFIE